MQVRDCRRLSEISSYDALHSDGSLRAVIRGSHLNTLIIYVCFVPCLNRCFFYDDIVMIRMMIGSIGYISVIVFESIVILRSIYISK
jgi:hypothetical protein